VARRRAGPATVHVRPGASLRRRPAPRDRRRRRRRVAGARARCRRRHLRGHGARLGPERHHRDGRRPVGHPDPPRRARCGCEGRRLDRRGRRRRDDRAVRRPGGRGAVRPPRRPRDGAAAGIPRPALVPAAAADRAAARDAALDAATGARGGAGGDRRSARCCSAGCCRHGARRFSDRDRCRGGSGHGTRSGSGLVDDEVGLRRTGSRSRGGSTGRKLGPARDGCRSRARASIPVSHGRLRRGGSALAGAHRRHARCGSAATRSGCRNGARNHAGSRAREQGERGRAAARRGGRSCARRRHDRGRCPRPVSGGDGGPAALGDEAAGCIRPPGAGACGPRPPARWVRGHRSRRRRCAARLAAPARGRSQAQSRAYHGPS